MKALWLGMIMLAGLAAMGRPAKAEPPRVVVTIKPIHALVSQVMTGIAVPELLVKGQASPHTYALRPSETRALNAADVFFRVGEMVEPFTAKIVTALPGTVAVVTLIDTPSLLRLERRTGATFEPHEHAGPDEAHTHDHVAGADADGHVWLDPQNARKMAQQIATVLSKRFPPYAAAFARNQAALDDKLVALDAELKTSTAPIKDKPFAVYHDALQYFEDRYGLKAVGAIVIGPDVSPSGKRLTELRQRVAKLNASCIFSEPQSDPRLVQAITEGSSMRTGVIDAEGLALEPGPDLYFALLRSIADNLRGCLLPKA